MFLIDEIRLAQHRDEDAMLRLITKFSPLLKKYGRKLAYEDAVEDLTLDFIELINAWNFDNFHQSSDGAVVKYIANSLYHCYLKRLKSQYENKTKCVSFEDLTPSQLNAIESETAVCDERALTTIIPDDILTPRELFIVIEIYEKETPVSSLARMLGVSRQNVNQIKRNAILKLQNWFDEMS